MAAEVNALSVQTDASLLFEKYSIEEIRVIEKQTRDEIEKKKEELRHMVGERYRDLIEAADTIKEMKTFSDNVVDSLSKMQDLCKQIKPMSSGSNVRPKRTRKKSQNTSSELEIFYAVASQIKLLLNTPEQIWSALEDSKFSMAAFLFLRAEAAHSALRTETRFLLLVQTRFPVILRQWATIAHFRNTILQTCRQNLARTDVSDESVAESLAAILFLEKSSQNEVFSEFLKTRLDTVTSLCESDRPDLAVRDQLCQVIFMIVLTVHQTHVIFHKNEAESHLLSDVVKRITANGEETNGIYDVTTQHHLPDNVKNFAVEVDASSLETEEQLLRAKCIEWLQKVKATVHAGLRRLLGFAPNIKGLAALRDAVWHMLNEEKRMTSWPDVCRALFETEINVWTEIFKDLFIKRAKSYHVPHVLLSRALQVILKDELRKAVSDTEARVSDVIADMKIDQWSCEADKEVSDWLWTEDGSDVSAQRVWKSGTAVATTTRKSQSESGVLAMKAKGYTTTVQNLVQHYDGALADVIQDLSCYLPADETEPVLFRDVSRVTQNADESFDRFEDVEKLLLAVSDVIEADIKKLVQFLSDNLATLRENMHLDSERSAVTMAVLLGRFALALTELSPNLQTCVIGQQKAEMAAASSESRGRKKSLKKRLGDNPKWTILKEELKAFGSSCFSVWTASVSARLLTSFKSQCLDRAMTTTLTACTKWESTEISEEAEGGNVVKSTIKVPSQPSWYVQQCLYDACLELNRVGGHALPRDTIQEFNVSLSAGILEIYENFVGNLPPQNPALQLLFDFRFLANLFARKDAAEHQRRSADVIEAFESCVDPFDLDVFSPYIQSNLTRIAQRTTVLYGCLSGADRRGPFGSRMTSTLAGQGEGHNVLPLYEHCQKLSLLPVSAPPRAAATMATGASSRKTSETESADKAYVDSVITEEADLSGKMAAATRATPTQQQTTSGSSFLSNVSTIWFSNTSDRK